MTCKRGQLNDEKLTMVFEQLELGFTKPIIKLTWYEKPNFRKGYNSRRISNIFIDTFILSHLKFKYL